MQITMFGARQVGTPESKQTVTDWVDRSRHLREQTIVMLEPLIDMAVLTYQMKGGPSAADFLDANRIGAQLSHGGDWLESNMLGKNDGKTAGCSPPPSLAQIAKAMACGAWCPGGLHFAGRHWEEK